MPEGLGAGDGTPQVGYEQMSEEEILEIYQQKHLEISRMLGPIGGGSYNPRAGELLARAEGIAFGSTSGGAPDHETVSLKRKLIDSLRFLAEAEKLLRTENK